MSDDPDNLMLVYLRRLDAKIDQVIDTQKDHGRRLTSLEIGLGELSAAVAHRAPVRSHGIIRQIKST